MGLLDKVYGGEIHEGDKKKLSRQVLLLGCYTDEAGDKHSMLPRVVAFCNLATQITSVTTRQLSIVIKSTKHTMKNKSTWPTKRNLKMMMDHHTLVSTQSDQSNMPTGMFILEYMEESSLCWTLRSSTIKFTYLGISQINSMENRRVIQCLLFTVRCALNSSSYTFD